MRRYEKRLIFMKINLSLVILITNSSFILRLLKIIFFFLVDYRENRSFYKSLQRIVWTFLDCRIVSTVLMYVAHLKNKTTRVRIGPTYPNIPAPRSPIIHKKE